MSKFRLPLIHQIHDITKIPPRNIVSVTCQLHDFIILIINEIFLYPSPVTDKHSDDTTNDEYIEETEHMKSFPNSEEINLDVANSKIDGEYFIPPMHVNPKVMENKNPREQEKENRKMLLHANRNSNLEKQKSTDLSKNPAGVFQKPLDIESAMGLYIVALIAGISAAFTVGLIAIGVFWFS